MLVKLPDYLEDVFVIHGRFPMLRFAINHAGAGDWAEFGVAAGVSARFLEGELAELSYDRLHLFDSFEGLPTSWKRRDGHFPAGRYKADVYEPTNESTVVNVGLYKDTLPGYFTDLNLGFVHIDCDLYQSTKEVLEHITPALSTGTVVVFDELFGYPGYEKHEHKALLEWDADYEWLCRDDMNRAALRVL